MQPHNTYERKLLGDATSMGRKKGLRKTSDPAKTVADAIPGFRDAVPGAALQHIRCKILDTNGTPNPKEPSAVEVSA